MTKIPLKAVTVTYTRTLTVAPTTEMFEDWEDCLLYTSPSPRD